MTLNRVISLLGIIFLGLAIMHLYFFFQTYPNFNLLDRKIVSCIGNTEIFGYTDSLGFPNLLNVTNSPYCISKTIGDKFEGLITDLNNNNRKTNLIAFFGYLISGILTIWDSRRKEN